MDMYKVCATCHKDLRPNVGYVLSNHAGETRAHHKECLPTPAFSKPKVWKYLHGYVDAD